MFFTTSKSRVLAGIIVWLSGALAQAAVTTQTFTFSPQILLGPLAASGNDTTPLTASFSKFNPALGTLTGVSFNYSFDFNQNILLGTAGGMISSNVGGPFALNTDPATGSGNGGGASGSPFTVATTPYSVVGAVSPSSVSGYAGATGSNTFTFNTTNTLNFDNTAASDASTATLNLLGSSKVTITYTYTPEPAALTVLAAGGLAALRQRRQREPDNKSL